VTDVTAVAFVLSLTFDFVVKSCDIPEADDQQVVLAFARFDPNSAFA
jgi:hypothetical protein